MSWRYKKSRMRVRKVAYGHWLVEILSDSPYRQKVIKSCTTTNSTAVDDFMSKDHEYEGRYLRVKSGTMELWGEVQDKYRAHA